MIERNNSKKPDSLKCILSFGNGRSLLKESCPKPMKHLLRRWFPCKYEAYKRRQWRAEDPHADAKEDLKYLSRVGVCFGIIKEFAHKHRDYISACRELRVPYKLLDISGPDWIDIVQNSGCDAFLIRPSSELSIWKQMFDERLRVMVEDLGKIIYPTYNELWFYESKRRMCYWLQAHEIPHPQTWIFYNFEDALEFARNTELPIVFKNDFGSAGSGIKLFRSRLRLVRWIERCFWKGTTCKDKDQRDRQWGTVLLQEYLANAKEWRVIRVDNSYFGRQKVRKGNFHSIPGIYGWLDPPRELLDFTREVTEEGQFTSMSIDIFETLEGKYYVNELHSVFGASHPHQMRVNGKPGRYIYEEDKAQWRFEEGEYNTNGSCNLRLKALLRMLNKEI